MKFGTREKTCFIIAVYITVILFWYIYLYLPKNNKLKAIKKDLTTIKMEATKIQKDISSINIRLNQESTILTKYNETKNKLPQRGDIVSILNALNQIKQEKHLRIISVQPTRFQLVEDTKTSDKLSLGEIPVKILLEGEFIDIGQYLFDLANLPFFGGYKNMLIESSEKIYPEIEAEITCIFLFIDNHEALSG